MAILDADRASSSENADDDKDDDDDVESCFFRANGMMILDRSIESTSGNVADAWSIGAYINTFQCTFLHNDTKL